MKYLKRSLLFVAIALLALLALLFINTGGDTNSTDFVSDSSHSIVAFENEGIVVFKDNVLLVQSSHINLDEVQVGDQIVDLFERFQIEKALLEKGGFDVETDGEFSGELHLLQDNLSKPLSANYLIDYGVIKERVDS